MSQIRLAVAGHFPSGDTPSGGVESVNANLVACLSQRESLDVHVVKHQRNVEAGATPLAGYTLYNLPSTGPRLIPNLLRTEQLATEWLRHFQPDAVISSHPSYTVAARNLDIPVVHAIHGMPAKEFWTRQGVYTRTATLAEIWLERRMLGRANHIIAISDQVVEIYAQRTSAIFHRVNNPIAPLFFEPSPAPEPHRLLLVGSLTPRKGIEIAIEAVKQLLPDYPDLSLEIAGPPRNNDYVRLLHRQANPLGPAIQFSGPMTQTGVKEALGHAQALLLTSYEEHAPMVVAEAMACGRPVVATRVGGLSDMVEPGVNGYLARAGDVETVAVGIRKLLANPEHAAKLGANAAQQARQRYHPEAVADGYMQAVKESMLEN